MGKERLFFTGSVNIIGDPRPSGQDLRVYACVSLHDGMSLVKGTGRGCYATFATLTAAVGCDPANLSRSLKRLVEWGYITEERQDDRRRKAYRVVFDSRETWRNRQRPASEIVGNGESGNGRNPPQTEQHYISLKGLYPPEGEKLNSSEEARFAARGSPRIEYSDNVGAQLATLERALNAGTRIDRQAWYEYLEELIGADEHPNNNARAARLAERLIDEMDDDEYRAWGESHGWVDGDGHWHAPHPRQDGGDTSLGDASARALRRAVAGGVA